MRQDHEEGLARQLRTGEQSRQKRKESFLSAASRCIFQRRFSNGPSCRCPESCEGSAQKATMTAQRARVTSSGGGQTRESTSRANEKAIGHIGIQRNGRCLRSVDHRTSERRRGRAFRSTAQCHPTSPEVPLRGASFIFSCALERHGNGFETIERKEHLDGYVKMTRDLQGELQAGFVVAAFEITNRLVVHSDRFGQLPPGYTALCTKN